MAGRISRRRLIGAGLAVGAVGVGGSGAVALTLERPAPGARVFSSREQQILAAVGEVLFPAGVFAIDGRDPWVLAEIDRIAATTFDALHARGFRYVLRSLEFGTIVRQGRPFSRLSVERRRAVLETWGDPDVLPRRVAWDSLRVVFGMAFFAHPKVIAEMGWRVGCEDRTP